LLPAQGKDWPMRDLINATFCVLRSGCPWRMVPDRFTPQTNGGNLRDSFSTRMSEKGRTSPFRGEGGKVRIRRFPAIRCHRDE
jgi:transposase